MKKRHVLFGIAMAGTAFLATVPASVTAEDGRTEIVVNETERDHILQEMRGLLEAVHGILDGAMTEDFDAVAREASAVGMVLAKGESPQLVAKLPVGFKVNGFAAHTAFDRLAQNALEFRNKDMVLEELTTILGACTSCHAGYRVVADQ